MYTLKQIPEDFIVKEIFDISRKLKDKGRFSYYTLRKRNYTTLQAIQKVAEQLHIELKNISFAGNKDRRAVTEQAIAILGKGRELHLPGIELRFLGYGDEPIRLGEHEKNEFIMTARNFDSKPALNSLEYFPNFFDKQRFSKNNPEIGKLLVKQDYKKAVELLLENGNGASIMKEALDARPNDYAGALRLLPRKLLKLYVHSYQSKLWNIVLARFLEKEHIDAGAIPERLDGLNIPILGFATELENETIEALYSEIMAEEQITARDFISRAMPELSSAGAVRHAFARIYGLETVEKEDDELNTGKQKIKIKFQLDTGCYATTALAYLLHDRDAC
ncbi:tRNA pseudouridine(13) synthase TruD [Candidatus Woesearchaeota archaeon]|nr:tRNA pseudouridine(13) synthase TruD [Candidatus Woesearchaeota archaeon]